jgi:hypothetical protein
MKNKLLSFAMTLSLLGLAGCATTDLNAAGGNVTVAPEAPANCSLVKHKTHLARPIDVFNANQAKSNLVAEARNHAAVVGAQQVVIRDRNIGMEIGIEVDYFACNGTGTEVTGP